MSFVSRLATAYILHDDFAYLPVCFHLTAKTIAFISWVPWHNSAGDWEGAAALAESLGMEVVLGDWGSELEHRQAVQKHLLEQGFTHALIPDGDEVIEPELLQSLIKIAENELADRVYVQWDTYWKSPEYVIRPRENFTPCILIDLRKVTPVGGRNFEGGRPLFLSAEHGIIHHLSYVGPDSRIQRKISTWGHAKEVVPGWYENAWERWDSDKTLHNLHPTHPQAYGFAERVPVPEILKPAMERYRELSGEQPAPALCKPASWPTVSVVIPVHGGAHDLRLCLNSLEECSDLLHKVIIVDNASPDDSREVAAEFGFVRVIANDSNAGFARACNQGFTESTGEQVLFLNSDTVVPRAGLLRLVESLRRSGTIAATGPWSNNVGHGQQISPTYTTLDTLDLFAEDFAHRSQEDVERDMLVGFCLLARRSALEEVAENGQVFDERFGLGTFEDNDLCYRLRRVGYKLMLSAKSFVHHSGSKTLTRVRPDVGALLAHNESLYRAKWREDIASGYASGLSGLTWERITFDPNRHPDARRKRVQELARQADISLCMIVKNEERVLADALSTAKPFFREIIVVDTGSTDRTVEIAEQAGVRVYSYPWTDSFSDARNESLKYANGKWVFWIDADDTLPWESGEAILQAALNAPPEITGFVVPVQFVDDGSPESASASGTRVDHVKMFRRLPGLSFEGRIHEQILPSLRRAMPAGQIVRIGAVVLHSGYDTSVEGQKKKRERDYKLLGLDLEERPDHPFVLFNFGMTDHYCNEHESAVRWLTRCIEVSEPTESHVRKAYALLAVSLRELGRTEESLAALEEGLSAVSEDPELHFHAGLLLTNLGRLEEAKVHYESTLSQDVSGHFSSVDIGILGYKTSHNLAGVCLSLGSYKEAKGWWQRAIAEAPQFLPSAFEMFNAALEADDLPTAKQALDSIQNIEGHGENWTSMSLRYAEAVGGPSNAEAHLHRMTAKSPDSVHTRLHLARKLLESGREQEAEGHLHRLNDQGVAEAAFFLGVSQVRRGDFRGALSWMERALALNPEHEPTREQIANLKKLLGNNDDDSQISITLEEALEQIAADFRLDAGELKAYTEEDTLGGYNLPDSDSQNRRWPGGSVWESEGKVLYALVRALKPETVVEIGSLVGCSTSHLASACLKNSKGTVYAVDPCADLSRVNDELRPYIQEVKEDVFGWTPPESIDFLFEDGSHQPGFTRKVLQQLIPSLAATSAVLCHDYATLHLPHVATEFREQLSLLDGPINGVLISPSDCGLGYCFARTHELAAVYAAENQTVAPV